MISDLIYISIGLSLLWAGGNYLVNSTVSLAKSMNLSTLFIGLTVVSFATSAPELLVSTQSILSGHYDIAIGNVIGSNIANIGLVLGVTTIISVISSKDMTKTIFSFLLAISFVPIILSWLEIQLNTYTGIIFLFLALIISSVILKGNKETTDFEFKKSKSILKDIALLIVSSLCLYFGSETLIQGTVSLAKHFNISEKIISVSIVAIGTSLPELSASISAAIKKEANLFLGNLVGSNIFNILLVLGFPSLIQNFEIPWEVYKIDFLFMMLFTIMLGVIIYFSSPKKMIRKEGIILCLCYLGYIYYSYTY